MTLNDIAKKLSAAGIENADGEALILAETFSGKSKEELLLERDAEIGTEKLEAAIARRISREPLQHIIGKWYFWREEYKVSPDCLIPRADSEIIVDFATKNLPHGARFLDLCTGSGCLAISILASRPDLSATALDISERALELARYNAKHNGVSDRIGFIRADVMKDELPDMGKFDAIVSNPPYIRTSEIDMLAPELSFEPRIALDGGADGLDFYKRILADFKKYLLPGGMFIFEIGHDEAEAIKALGGADTKLFRDYSKNYRMAVIKA